MKKTLTTYTKNISRLAMVCLAISGITSCNNAVFDNEGDCDPRYFIKFEYTMHMEYGDAFKEQVQAVDLWIFDKTTNDVVDHIYKTVDELKATDYLLPIDVNPGEYNFVAWCGHIDNRHFKHNDNISQHTHATAHLYRRGVEEEAASPNKGMATSDENLDLFFHGQLNDAVLPTWEQLQSTEWNKGYEYSWDQVKEQHNVIYTIPLVRDVNNITLTIQHRSSVMNTDTKRITLIDNNGSMHHDNSIDETDQPIVYKPWSINTGLLEGEYTSQSNNTRAENEAEESSQQNFMKVELSTGRLMADHNPYITISDIETGKTIISFPLTNWLLQLRSAQYGDMTDQEYLDRKNNHELYVILDDDGKGGWMAVSIVINGWHIVDNGEVDL